MRCVAQTQGVQLPFGPSRQHAKVTGVAGEFLGGFLVFFVHCVGSVLILGQVASQTRD